MEVWIYLCSNQYSRAFLITKFDIFRYIYINFFIMRHYLLICFGIQVSWTAWYRKGNDNSLPLKICGVWGGLMALTLQLGFGWVVEVIERTNCLLGSRIGELSMAPNDQRAINVPYRQGVSVKYNFFIWNVNICICKM